MKLWKILLLPTILGGIALILLLALPSCGRRMQEDAAQFYTPPADWLASETIEETSQPAFVAETCEPGTQIGESITVGDVEFTLTSWQLLSTGDASSLKGLAHIRARNTSSEPAPVYPLQFYVWIDSREYPPDYDVTGSTIFEVLDTTLDEDEEFYGVVGFTLPVGTTRAYLNNVDMSEKGFYLNPSKGSGVAIAPDGATGEYLKLDSLAITCRRNEEVDGVLALTLRLKNTATGSIIVRDTMFYLADAEGVKYFPSKNIPHNDRYMLNSVEIGNYKEVDVNLYFYPKGKAPFYLVLEGPPQISDEAIIEIK